MRTVDSPSGQPSDAHGGRLRRAARGLCVGSVLVAVALLPRVSAAAEPSRETKSTTAEHSHVGARQRVMVLDVRTIDPKLSVAAPFASLIASQIAKHAEYDVASTDDVQRLVQAQSQKRAAGCAEDDECLVEISRKVNADLIVNGTIGKVGQSYVLTLALLPQKDLQGGTRASETVDRVEELPKAVERCLAKLFHWSSQSIPRFHLPKGQKLSFAVFDLKPTGLTAEIAQNLTQVLTTEVKGVQGASVVSRDDIAAMLQLESAKMKAGCDDAGCMAEIGGALGVDRLITGDAGKVGTLYIVNLRLIDVRHGTVENRATESFQGDEEELLRAVRHAARSLLGLAVSGKGQIVVTANQPSADVFVDDGQKGQAPTKVVDLNPTRYRVRVARNGFFDWQGDVYVDPLEATSVWAQLSPRPQAWYQKWWVWTVGGAVVAGAVVAAIVATRPPSKTVDGTVTYR